MCADARSASKRDLTPESAMQFDWDACVRAQRQREVDAIIEAALAHARDARPNLPITEAETAIATLVLREGAV